MGAAGLYDRTSWTNDTLRLTLSGRGLSFSPRGCLPWLSVWRASVLMHKVAARSCSHAGIVNVVKDAVDRFSRPIYMVTSLRLHDTYPIG